MTSSNAAQKRDTPPLTSDQETLAKFLQSQGYTDLILADRSSFHGLKPMAFTWGLFCNLHWSGYSHRYCFHNQAEAMRSYQDWSKVNFIGDPEGFIVRKPERGPHDRREN